MKPLAFLLYVCRPLVYLGMNLMNHFDVCSSLGCDESVLHNWLMIIEMNYNAKNSYHTSTHAADVMQATAGFLERERLKQILDPIDEAVCLIAAAAHDVDHPGKSRSVQRVSYMLQHHSVRVSPELNFQPSGFLL
jgi:high affinity cAMP-specific and IBMX-insensitive 3',5'-cyclic phosphodiesterase 8